MNSIVSSDDSSAAVNRSKLEQAAIVILGLGDRAAARVLRLMSAKNVSQLMQVMPRVTGVVESELETIMDKLVTESNDAPLFNDKSGIDRALRKVLGEKRARDLLQSSQGDKFGEVLEKLLMLDPKLVARLIANEHPQLQAITLACIEPSKSAHILQRFSEERQNDLTHRMANLSSVPTSSLEAIAGLLDSLTQQEVSTYAINGVGQLAEVLNHMDAESGDDLLDNLRTADDELADQVASLRFTFEHVLELELDSLRVVCEAADNEILSIALRGVVPERQEYVYSCMGKRAAAMLREEVESGVSMRASRVNDARVQLTALARRLAREGQIELVSSADEMVG